jgi:leucyl aminopeptidase (aminopeptidase T)
MLSATWLRCTIAATILVASTTAGAQSRNSQNVARNLVQAGMVKTGDKVLVSGSVRDAPLLEDIAVEVMKVGAHPLITIWSDRLTRRSYDEVPATFDNITSPIGKLFVENFDVQIALDVGEAEGLLAGVPVTRMSARSKANEPINQAYFQRNVRSVNLGTGLYPTATASRRLGVPQSTMASAFWKAASVNPASLRATAESLRRTIANGKVVTVTAPNGTNVSFGLNADRAMISDGALTAEKVKRGSAAASTWLPAGELLIPAVDGTANGKVVVDKVLWDGRVIRGLTLLFRNGVLESMTAANDMARLKAQYDASTGAKDRFQGIDIGVNPEMRLPVGSGRIVWGAPGSVVVGFGDNRGLGGENASDFGVVGQLGNATVKVDGTPIISNGRLQR